jgi:protocatechuate 3,4-dioxygenase beta subunit
MCVAAVGVIRAAEVNEYAVDVRVNVEDQRTLSWVARLLRTDPDGTTQALQIDPDTRIEATVTSAEGNRNLRVALVSSAGGAARKLAELGNLAATGSTWSANFSICGDRIIAVGGGAVAGRCADLPPMSRPDPQVRPCERACNGPYEGMPSVITSHARIAPVSEPGEPLRITGRVVGPDGRPRAGIIVYAYHTNRLGIYPPPVPPRSQDSNFDGQLRGWARTDEEGRYTFDTIRPGSYPSSNNPQHVHMSIIEPGCAFYYINEIQFSDDPLYRRQSAQERRMAASYATVTTPRRTPAGWEVSRDIHLGEGVPGYKPCPVTP